MSLILIVIHVIVCIALILIVLLQTGKGADMGAAFGAGSSNTLFGTTGATSFLGKLTTVAAVVFMLTSFTLAYMSGNRPGRSVMEQAPVAQQPAAGEEQTAPAPQGAAETGDTQQQAASTEAATTTSEAPQAPAATEAQPQSTEAAPQPAPAEAPKTN